MKVGIHGIGLTREEWIGKILSFFKWLFKKLTFFTDHKIGLLITLFPDMIIMKGENSDYEKM